MNKHNHKKTLIDVCPTGATTKVRRSILISSCLEEEVEEKDVGVVRAHQPDRLRQAME